MRQTLHWIVGAVSFLESDVESAALDAQVDEARWTMPCR